MLAQIGAQLGIDSSFFVQFFLLVVLYAVLGPMFFRPFQRLFQLRHEKTTGYKGSADELFRKSDELQARFNELLKGQSVSVRNVLKDAETKAQSQAASILANAEGVARQRAQDVQKALLAERSELEKELSAEGKALGQKIAEKLLAPLAQANQVSR